MHVGVKRKRVRAAADAAQKRVDEVGAPGGAWHPAQHRRVVHQAAFAAEAMHESRAVYAVLVARRCQRTGAIVSETWGSEPWVAGELGGTTGVLEIVFRGHAARHISAAPTPGLGDFEPVTESLRACGLASLAEKIARSQLRRRRVPRARGGVRVERGVRGERAGTFGRRHGGG